MTEERLLVEWSADAGNNNYSNQIAATLTERQRFCWLEGKHWTEMGESLGKFRHWWWNSVQIVQRSGRRVGRAVIQRRLIPGGRVFILPTLPHIMEKLKTYRWVVVESFVEAFVSAAKGEPSSVASGEDGLLTTRVAETATAS